MNQSLNGATKYHKMCQLKQQQEHLAASNQHEARMATPRRGAKETQCAVAEHPEESCSSRSVQHAKAVVVLRRCEDLHVRTSGFQKIEEESQCRPLDLRRHKLLLQSSSSSSLAYPQQ